MKFSPFTSTLMQYHFLLKKNLVKPPNLCFFFQSRVSKWCRLQRVFTLDPYLPEYSIAQVKPSDNPEMILPQGSQEWEPNIGAPITAYQITLRFESADYGSFQQRLVFDFAEQPLVFRQLEVVVAPEQSLLHTIQYPAVCDEDSELSWLAKYQMVPFDPQNLQGNCTSSHCTALSKCLTVVGKMKQSGAL